MALVVLVAFLLPGFTDSAKCSMTSALGRRGARPRRRRKRVGVGVEARRPARALVTVSTACCTPLSSCALWLCAVCARAGGLGALRFTHTHGSRFMLSRVTPSISVIRGFKKIFPTRRCGGGWGLGLG